MNRYKACAPAFGFVAIAMVSSAQAKTAHQASMTCREFLSLDTIQRPNIVYWAEGVNNKGKPEDAIVDMASTERVIPIVEEKCRIDPMAQFWAKLDASWHEFEADVKRHL